MTKRGGLPTMICVLLVLVALAPAASDINRHAPTRIETDSRPDTFGYYYVDSDTTPGTPGRPTYNWIDIRSRGTKVEGLVDDNLVGPFSLGFVWPHYWQRYTSFFIGSNGYLAFDDDFNSAHPFPDMPSAQRPNNLIAPFMSDIDFNVVPPNGGCWYWTNLARDTFIVQYESIPFFFVPNSYNSFQIILSRIDTTVTFQYRVQTGAPYLGWGPDNITVGIENITGRTGVRYLYGNIPSRNAIHPGLAVRFYPPGSSNYTISDVWTKHVMTHNSLALHLHSPAIQNRGIWARFRNSGNQVMSNIAVNAEIYRLPLPSPIWAAAGLIPVMAIGYETTLVFGEWAPPDTGTYSVKVWSSPAQAGYRGDDTVLVEIHVADYQFPTTLSYDRATSGNYSLLGPHGFGVKFVPPRYPVRIDKAYFTFSGSMVPVTVYVCDDNGYLGGPGTILDSAVWTPRSGLDSVNFGPDSINVLSGGFFIGYVTQTSMQPRIAYDEGVPHSRQNYEWTGGWAMYRMNETRDFRIRARVAMGPAIHNVGVTEVLQPAGLIDSGTVVAPKARVRNVGLWHENNVSVTFKIAGNPAYLASESIRLDRGRDTVVTFAPWSARPGFGQLPRCSVYIANDADPENDTLSGAFVDVRYLDVGVNSIDRPGSVIELGQSFAPRVTLRNHGNCATPFVARFRIPEAGYLHSSALYYGAGRQDTLAFPTVTLDTGNYTLSCSTELAGDMNPGNNRVLMPLLVRYADVAANAILAPSDSADSGAVVVPIVRVSNLGNTEASFDVRLSIAGEGYLQTRARTLAAHATDTVTFPAWTPRVFGSHAVVCSLIYAPDRVAGNNRLEKSVFVRVLDVGVAAISAPTGEVDSGAVVVPEALVRNFGRTSASFDARFTVDDGYSQVTRVEGLAAGGVRVVQFAPWTAARRGNRALQCFTAMPGDLRRENDTAAGSVGVMLRDVLVQEILAPRDTIDTASCIPLVRVVNAGTGPASFIVWCRITGTGGVERYLGTLPVSGLAAGASLDAEMPVWTGPLPSGRHTVQTNVTYVGDMVPTNDSLAGEVLVSGRQRIGGWIRRADIPLGPRSKRIKDGGAIAYVPASDSDYVYALKGNGTLEFYQYGVPANTWVTRESVPAIGSMGKKKGVKKGGTLVNASSRYYVTKGNNTLEFWKYDPTTDEGSRWSELAGIPSVKGLKDGASASLVTLNGTDYIYLLKGSNSVEFYRYNTAGGTWETLPSAPRGVSGKTYKAGSCITWDSELGVVYLLKGNYNEFYSFRLDSNTWQTLEKLPLSGNTGRRKKAKAGASVAVLEGRVYALKGGNTTEFWNYFADSNRWHQLEDMPVETGRRVKGGGALIRGEDDGYGVLWAFKGNSTYEFWQYVPYQDVFARPGGFQAASRDSRAAELQGMQVTPNPFTGSTVLSYAMTRPGAVRVRLFDLSGALVSTLVRSHAASGSHRQQLNLAGLPRGVYLLAVEAGELTQTRKLIVE